MEEGFHHLFFIICSVIHKNVCMGIWRLLLYSVFGTCDQWQPTGKMCTGHNLLNALPVRCCDGTQLFRCWFSHSKAIKPWRKKGGSCQMLGRLDRLLCIGMCWRKAQFTWCWCWTIVKIGIKLKLASFYSSECISQRAQSGKRTSESLF